MKSPPNLSQILIFHKYNRSPNGMMITNNPDSDKTISKYIYGDDVKNIDHKVSAKTGQLYTSTRKSEYKPNIYIYLDQNSNRNYQKEYIYNQIEIIKKYISDLWIKFQIYEFGSLEWDEYISSLWAITHHIRNREVDLPVIIISDRLAIDKNIIDNTDHIYSLTDLFLFAVTLPNFGQNYHSFYLDKSLKLNVEIHDL